MHIAWSSGLLIICAFAGSGTTLAIPSPRLPTALDNTTGVTYQGNASMGVESFYNIRYGADTSGANRFASPHPYSYPRSTVVNASVIVAACPQDANPEPAALFKPIKDISEDCLNLRIDRLQNVTSASNLPVMVYIYGGGWVSGQIYDSTYDPTGLLKTAAANGSPVIYVAINYRVTMFGFASSTALASADSLNIGLEDQRLGLEWVKKNILIFGDNPNNVTVFGESAGAISIGHQINAYGGTKPVPFHRAIIESGASTTVAGTTSNISALHTAGVADLANCTSTNSTLELACLRALPLDTLLPIVVNYQKKIHPVQPGLYAWQPVVPSSFIPDRPSNLLRDGRFAKDIDIIAGCNNNDGFIFVSPNTTTDTEVLSSATYPGTLDNTTAQEALSLYPLSSFSPMKAGNKTIPAQYFRAAQMNRDSSFLCPSILVAQTMRKASSPTITNYLFINNQSLFTPELATENLSYLGVPHGSDLGFVFNEVSEFPNTTQSDVQLGDSVSASCASFANTGNTTLDYKIAFRDWPQGYLWSGEGEGEGPNNKTGSSDPTLSAITVWGGPSDGPAYFDAAAATDPASSGGVLASQDIVRRCAFWNSEEVLNQLQI